ncbi:Adaptive-response sensory-kinase SasA [bioreactor metagenome]|uniref:histidine kinase n=1 Tax=bioreactor metagenome TaxID=1076179 RepID=A0A644W231_9ZZZZ
MERCKVILSDKNIRREAIVIVMLLLLLILVSQLAVAHMAQDLKKAMIEHDYTLAGYLSGSGMDKNQIIKAFTSDKTAADTEFGWTLFSASGYDESTRISLLPEVEQFKKYSILMLACSISFSAAFLTAVYFGILHRETQLDHAVFKLRLFMGGDTSVRLQDESEGGLSRLFSSVNAMATSLTAHVETEKQNREFLKETISDISHQLKTPLAALGMYNEIIMDENTGNPVVDDFTSKSSRELLRMESLIQSLLKLARLDAGTIELHKNTHAVRGFLENIRSSFLTRAEQEGKSITLQCGDSTLLSLDEIWLTEAVGNIVKNALDHTRAGDQIEIFCVETVVATEIIIKDNGTGIHPEDIHHIFKRFYRSRFSNDSQGVGIGLALSKSIAEKHGATITVQSEPGYGAEFHFIFPKLTNL